MLPQFNTFDTPLCAFALFTTSRLADQTHSGGAMQHNPHDCITLSDLCPCQVHSPADLLVIWHSGWPLSRFSALVHCVATQDPGPDLGLGDTQAWGHNHLAAAG